MFDNQYYQKHLKENGIMLVRKTLLSDKTDREKLQWLLVHFKTPQSQSFEAIHLFVEYFKHANRLMEMEIEEIEEMGKIYKRHARMSEWNFIVASVVNRSEKIPESSKLIMLLEEFYKGNHKVIKQISREFYASLSQEGFNLVKTFLAPTYIKNAPERWKAIEEARGESSSSSSDENVYSAVEIPTPTLSRRSSSEGVPSVFEMKKETKVALTTSTAIGAITGGVVGFFLGGPVLAAVMAVTGAAAGLLAGMIFLGIKSLLTNKETAQSKKDEAAEYVTPPLSPDSKKPVQKQRESLVFRANRALPRPGLDLAFN